MPKDTRMEVQRSLNGRQIAIILASLRIAQEEGMDRLNGMPQMTVDGYESVTKKEIDDLCEFINRGA